jgi:DNA-binding response OmpR family regulator
MKILIVDDENLVRMSIRRAAEMRGHEVIEAKDGLEGLKLWRETNPELVYLDVLMPGLTGPALLKEMGQTTKAKVIMISAYMGDVINDVQALPKGAALFIAKPFGNIFEVIEKGEALVLNHKELEEK